MNREDFPLLKQDIIYFDMASRQKKRLHKRVPS